MSRNPTDWDWRKCAKTRHGQAQLKGQLHFLAFLGEKRLAQKQHHQQKSQRKQTLPGKMNPAHLQRPFQIRNPAGKMHRHRQQKATTQI